MRPGKARVKRVEITRRNDNDAARVEITMAKRERRAGIGQVLDHVEHHNDVHHPELGEVAFIGNSGRYVQSALAAGAARSVGNFDASHIVESLTVRLPPPDLPGGISRTISSHSSSVTSLG
jgi:hypothetical protein